MNMPHRGSERVNGFTLLEALVTLVVISVGLLGLLGLQTVSVVSTQTSEARSLASIAADDIGERIRANPAGAEANHYDLINAPIHSENETPPGTDCLTELCSAEQMATLDIWEWEHSLYNGFRAKGYVDCTKRKSKSEKPGSKPPCTAYTVTVAWNERETPGHTPDGNDKFCADTRFGMRCFITVLRP